MTRIGFMQGRLLPPETDAIQAFPVRGWREEFPLAAEAGLEAVEWIYDAHGEGRNPLETDEGIEEILAVSDATGVAVAAVCDDWLMPNPLARGDDVVRGARVDHLRWAISRAARVGAARVVIPFLEESALVSADEEALAIDALQRVLPDAERQEIEIHLETSLDPPRFRDFLARIEHTLVKVTYDSGNSAALGHDPVDELAAYGPRVGSVHVKDRVRGGGTVPLGTGDADLPAVFGGLETLGYDGDIVLQVARDRPGDECAWMGENRRMVESLRAAAVVRR